MEFINSINNRSSILYSNENGDNNKNNDYEFLNNININNTNADIYIKPKLILSHNITKNYLINKNDSNQRKSSYEKLNKKFYYPQANNIYGKSKIDFIQLNFTKANDKGYFKNKLNKNLSHEIYKKSKRYIKSNKYLHKSLSQKYLNINNNDISYYKDINKENSINKNHIIIPSDNSQYIPTKNSTINYAKSQNDYSNICITNNEEFQIIPQKKTIDTSINRNDIIFINKKKNDEKSAKTKENFKNDENCENLMNFPLAISIKVNKKENIESKSKIIKECKEYKKQKALQKKEIVKKEVYSTQLKYELKKNEFIKNFISKYNKNRLLLKQNERKNNIINNKFKEKELNIGKSNSNDNFKRKRILKHSSQEYIFKHSNKIIQNKIIDNNKIEKKEKKNFSIRSKYKNNNSKHK